MVAKKKNSKKSIRKKSRKKSFNILSIFRILDVTNLKIWRKNKWSILSVFTVLVIVSGTSFFIIGAENQARGETIDAKKIVAQRYNEETIVSVGEQELRLRPVGGKSVKVRQEDVRYIYEKAYKHTDVIQSVYPYKIKEELVFYEPGHPLEFKYKLGNVDKFIVRIDDEGNIIFYDKQRYEDTGESNRIFTIPTPFIEDKVGRRSFSAVTTVLDEDSMTISVDPKWLKTAVYPVVLDPTVEISVLNVHSHPRKGDNWEVSFTTAGKADLSIIPTDQATVRDDDFVSLSCDGEERIPQILPGDVIFFPDWECAGTGKVVHYTNTAGDHILKFEFASAESYVEINDESEGESDDESEVDDEVSGGYAEDYAFNSHTPGDFMVRRNATDATALADGGTTVDVNWDSLVDSNGSSISYATSSGEGVFTLASGKYLVMYNEYYQQSLTDNNERIEIQGRLVVGGTATTTGAGAGYMRTRTYNHDAMIHGAAIVHIPTDSTTLEVRFYRTDNSTDNGVVRNIGRGGVTILALDDTWNYGRYSLSSSVSPPPTGGADVVWVDSDQEDTDFSMTSGVITISSAGRYLVIYSIPLNCTGTGTGGRTEYTTLLTRDDSEIEGTQVSTYCRGDTDSANDSVTTYVGVIDIPADGGSDDLAVEMTLRDGTGTNHTLDANSNIQILQLPAGAETIIVTDAAGTNDMDPAVEAEFTFDTNDPGRAEDAFSFTTSTSFIQVDVDDDYLFFASVHADAGGSTRAYAIGRFSVQDTPLTYGGGEYSRSSGANYGGYAFGTMIPANALDADDAISLEVQGVGQNTGALDNDGAAMSAIRLGSLFAAANSPPTIDSFEDYPDPAIVGQSVTFSVDWTDSDAEGVKLYICTTDAATVSGCTVDNWCTNSDDFETSDPITCGYTALVGDVGSNDYFAFVCDDEDCVATSGSGTFFVKLVNPNSMLIKGGFRIDGGMRIK